MAKKKIMIISFSLFLLVSASLITIYILRQKNIEAASKFINEYLQCTAPQNFGITALKTISQAEKYFADNAKITIKNSNQNTTVLSASQYLRQLAKMNFTQTIQKSILARSDIKTSFHSVTIGLVENYVIDGRISISDTTITVEKSINEYRIKEIQQIFRSN
jgi:autotransporter translocation and assembly factor TamB